MQTLTLPETREETLNEIAELEARLLVLRELLPSPVKSFYRFRVKPGRSCWVYAASREQAEERLQTRMNRDYPHGWELASQVVDVIHDPTDAANQTSGSLMRAVSRAEALEFLNDYRSNQRGRETARPRELPASTLERDIAAFEQRLKEENG